MLHNVCHCCRPNHDSWQSDCSHFGRSSTPMESNQFEKQAEISNMIAEGGPASPEGNISATGRLAAASTLVGARVLKSAAGEELGHIEAIMLDLRPGWIAYAVLSFTGFPGIVDQRFPVPWNALRIDRDEFILDLDR